MSKTERILILTLSFGAGHVSAAKAVAKEFARQPLTTEVSVVDALESCRLPFRAFYVWTYWAMIRFAPTLWEKFFAARVSRQDEQTAPVWALRWGFAAVLKEIETFQPDLIIACEVAASELAVIAHREQLTNAQIINVITDFEAEPIWVKPEISAFAVPTKDVAEQLEGWGASSKQIKICGIPLDPSFVVKLSARETREKFNFDQRPLVLLMGGGMGPTRMDAVASGLLKSGDNLQIIALPGRDLRARRQLKKLKNTETVSLQVLDWTTEVAALMQIAQILVTKPGGVTLAEAAACGVPLVLFDAIPGPEETNAARFSKAGAALMTRGAGETTKIVLELLGNQRNLDEMSLQVKKLAELTAAQKIVQMVLGNKTNKADKPEKHQSVGV